MSTTKLKTDCWVLSPVELRCLPLSGYEQTTPQPYIYILIYMVGVWPVQDANRNDILRQLYDNPKTGVGVGLKGFYFTVRNKSLNIFRNQCADFLRQQKVFQMTRTMQHKINKPILSEQSNECWSIDLVDMGRYKGNNQQNRLY